MQDAVIRNYEIVGEAAKRIPDAFRTLHPEIDWRRLRARDEMAGPEAGVAKGTRVRMKCGFHRAASIRRAVMGVAFFASFPDLALTGIGQRRQGRVRESAGFLCG